MGQVTKPVWSGRAEVECGGKDRLTASQAREIADEMRRRNRNRRISAYHCPSCGQWHVGSMSGAGRAMKIANKQATRSRVSRGRDFLDEAEGTQ